MPGEVTKVEYNAETGTLEGAGYKALVIYQDWMDPDGAETILELAKQGMPVVILENAARSAPLQVMSAAKAISSAISWMR